MKPLLRATAIRVFTRFPGLLRAAYAAWEPILRVALLPFRLPKRRGRAIENGATAARAAEYNAAAERYFADHAEPWLLLTKPFSDPTLLARCLIDAGALIVGARLRPGDIVVEIGAGSCWLSHLLNRYGCRTISVDVSPTVLGLGRQRFERDPWTNWSLEPRFLSYDGHRLPLDDGSCDRIVLYDAFHHIPNQRELLAEMHRILVPDGVVAMSEPGQGHASSPTSVAETLHWEVLENELVVEDLAALAEAVGFREVNVLAEGPTRRFELPAGGIGRFRGGVGFRRYWTEFCHELTRHHCLLLYKSGSVATTARPGRLGARLQLQRPPDGNAAPRGGAAGRPARGQHRRHALAAVRRRSLARRVDAPRRPPPRGRRPVREGDRFRLASRGARPGRRARRSPHARLVLPALERPGTYDLHFDLVVEGYTWFAARGVSRPPVLRVSVE